MLVEVFSQLKIPVQISVTIIVVDIVPKYIDYYYYFLILDSGLQNDHRKGGHLGFYDGCTMNKASILFHNNLKCCIIEIFVKCRC